MSFPVSDKFIIFYVLNLHKGTSLYHLNQAVLFQWFRPFGKSRNPAGMPDKAHSAESFDSCPVSAEMISELVWKKAAWLRYHLIFMMSFFGSNRHALHKVFLI